MPQRKILYSPRFGAGWTTWASDPELKKLMLDFPPLVEAIEKGENICEGIKDYASSTNEHSPKHPAMKAFFEACKNLGKDVPYLGGARDLKVATVHGRVRIEEYDGNESVEEEGEFTDWM